MSAALEEGKREVLEAVVAVEMAVLGHLFADGGNHVLIPFLVPEHYFNALHAAIHSAIVRCATGRPTDTITLKAALEPQLDGVGGADYVERCLDQSILQPDLRRNARHIIEARVMIDRANGSSEAEARARQYGAYNLRMMPYPLYLATSHWREVREAALERARYRCQLCGRANDTLEVHHNTYERRGAELPSDVLTLCRRCHEDFHARYPRPIH